MASNSLGSTETTTIALLNNVTINGRTFKKGPRVEVPKRQAEDILRMDHDHNQYLLGLNKKHTYEVDAGTMAVGSGAE